MSRHEWWCTLDMAMAATVLHPLTCSNCGAQLTAEPDGSLIRCAYCRAEHVFAPPPAPVAGPQGGHLAGEAVRVEWGGRWWNAHVVEVAGPAEWKIHYDGWPDRWDEIVSTDRIAARGDGSPKSSARGPRPRTKGYARAVGAGIVILAVALGIWASHRPDSRASAGLLPSASSSPGTPIESNAALQEGEPVWAYSMEQWWPAEIVRPMPNGRYEVRYIGYDKTWNESLLPVKLRHRR